MYIELYCSYYQQLLIKNEIPSYSKTKKEPQKNEVLFYFRHLNLIQLSS